MTKHTQWTENDVALLYSVYIAGETGPLVFPPELLARHSISSCTHQAHRRGFTNRERPRRRFGPFELSEVDAAYLAGIIDGEGHVFRNGGSVISVSSTTREITDWLYRKVPGSHLAEPRWPKNPNAQLVHRWEVTNHETAQMLARQIADFILIPYKRERLKALAVGANRKMGIENPDLSPSPLAMGVAGMKSKTHCLRGHDRRGLPVGANCPECAKIYKQRLIDKGAITAGGRPGNRTPGNV